MKPRERGLLAQSNSKALAQGELEPEAATCQSRVLYTDILPSLFHGLPWRRGREVATLGGKGQHPFYLYTTVVTALMDP